MPLKGLSVHPPPLALCAGERFLRSDAAYIQAMLSWVMWPALVLGMLTATAVGLSAYGDKRWADATRTLTGALEAARTGEKHSSAARFDPRELEGLPAPVQRYFHAVLKEGQPIIVAATLEIVGTLNLSATGEQWKPFTSRQRVVIHRPGFLWDARVSMLPGLPVGVHDSYIAGVGMLHAAVLGLFKVADLQGGGEIARGELMRFFAEMAWYPTALLPSQGVRWEALDDRSAHATIVDGPLTLTLLFRFNEAGLIDSVRAEARGAMMGNKMVMLPWEGSWSDYQARDGMTVPIKSEAAWLRPAGRKPYFRGTVTSLTYELSP
jgi:hypothetical protein